MDIWMDGSIHAVRKPSSQMGTRGEMTRKTWLSVVAARAAEGRGGLGSRDRSEHQAWAGGSDRWVVRRMGGQTDGWVDGWVDGWMEGRVCLFVCFIA